jgi:PEP-CTERM motif
MGDTKMNFVVNLVFAAVLAIPVTTARAQAYVEWAGGASSHGPLGSMTIPITGGNETSATAIAGRGISNRTFSQPDGHAFSALAKASLTSGSIGVHTAASSDRTPLTYLGVYGGEATAYAAARIQDRLFLSPPSASDDPLAPNHFSSVNFVIGIDGSWNVGQDLPGLDTGRSGIYLATSIELAPNNPLNRVSTAVVHEVYSLGVANTGNSLPSTSFCPSAGATALPANGVSWRCQVSVIVSGTAPFIDLSYTMTSISKTIISPASDANFGSTGTIAFGSNPIDMTWTSGSGVFLSAVPEPGAFALFGVGGCLLLAFAKRRA